ncbi:MAG: hypothetical protein ABW101_10520 [Candidatus Thiodiazotropha sp.]
MTSFTPITNSTSSRSQTADRVNNDSAQQTEGQALYSQASQSLEPEVVIKGRFEQRNQKQKAQLANEFIESAGREGIDHLALTPSGQHALAVVYDHAGHEARDLMRQVHEEQGNTAVDYTLRYPRTGESGAMMRSGTVGVNSGQLSQTIPVGDASDADLQAVLGPVPEGADSNNQGSVILNEGLGSKYTFDDIAAEPDRRGYFERIGSGLKGSVIVDQSLTERLGNAFDAAYYGAPNTNTDGIESSVLFAKGFGEQLSDGWQELMADPFSIIRDPLTLAYDQIETAFYLGTNGFLGDPNSMARNQERGESLINLANSVEVVAGDSEKAGYLFGGAILGLKKGKLPGGLYQGKVAIAQNLLKNKLPLQKEIDIANALAENKEINVLLRGANTPNGDATIMLLDGTRLRAEFKTFEDPGVPISELSDNRIKRIFERNINDGSAQVVDFPSAVALDTRALSLSDEKIQGFINRALGNVAQKRPNLQQIFAVTNNGVIQVPVVRNPQ